MMKREYFPNRVGQWIGCFLLGIAIAGCGGPDASRPDEYPPAPKSDEVAVEGDDGATGAEEAIEAPPQ